MKELKLTKLTELGKIEVKLRIIRHKIYFRFNNTQYTQQAIAQYKAKGVKIRQGNGWLEIDIFGDKNFAKVGDYEIDLEEDSNEKIETNLRDFYLTQYIKSGFKLE